MKVRKATRKDADAVGTLAKEFADYLRTLGDPTNFRFNAATFLRDGFGKESAFKGLVAEIDGVIAGYLLYHAGYYVDEAMRVLYIVDLYVRPDYRRHGIGKALMKRAGKICIKAGGKRLFWHVWTPNSDAFRFYKRIGGRYTNDLKYMCLPLDNGGVTT